MIRSGSVPPPRRIAVMAGRFTAVSQPSPKPGTSPPALVMGPFKSAFRSDWITGVSEVTAFLRLIAIEGPSDGLP